MVHFVTLIKLVRPTSLNSIGSTGSHVIDPLWFRYDFITQPALIFLAFVNHMGS